MLRFELGIKKDKKLPALKWLLRLNGKKKVCLPRFWLSQNLAPQNAKRVLDKAAPTKLMTKTVLGLPGSCDAFTL